MFHIKIRFQADPFLVTQRVFKEKRQQWLVRTSYIITMEYVVDISESSIVK